MVEKSDLKVNQVWEGKKPKKTILGYYNDRQIIYLGNETLQYDSITVRQGAKYPRISIEDFLKWAGRDVTAEMPQDGSWRSD